MKKKFSAGLSALMVLLVTGSALAEETYVDAKVIDYRNCSEGTFNFKSGDYTGELIHMQTDNLGSGADFTINIEKNGCLKITHDPDSSYWYPIDISNGASEPELGKECNIIINGDIEVSMNNEHHSDSRSLNVFNGGDTLNINGSYNLKNYKDTYTGSSNIWNDGIRVYAGNLNVRDNFSIDSMQVSTENSNKAYVNGIYNIGSQGMPSSITLGSSNNDVINVKNINVETGHAEITLAGIYTDIDSDIPRQDSTITLNGKTTVDNISGVTNNADVNVFGLLADRGQIIVNGDLSVTNIKGTTSGEGVESMVKALYACEGGLISVNSSLNRTVKIDGDVSTDDDANSLITINLSDANSYINGAINGHVDVNMAKGSVWRVKQGISTGDAQNSYVTSLKGDGDIEMDIDASKNTGNPHLFIEEFEGAHNLILNNIGSDDKGADGNVLVSVKSGNGTLTVPASEGGLYWTKYELGTQNSSETDYTKDWYLKDTSKSPVNPDPDPTPKPEPDPDPNPEPTPNPAHPGAYTTTVKTLLAAVTSAYDTWRSDADKLNERMGELRLSGKDAEGVWVRTKASQFGRHANNGAYENQQYTYQLGYDAVTSKDAAQTTYTGVAAEYGKGSLSLERGTGTMRSVGLGLYQTQLRESGHYLDFVYKFDKYKNDFHVADTQGNPISGKYGNNAMSLSAEYGRKNALKNGWYIEPQAEMTLGYMWGNDFTTSNNIKVEQKNMPALIGRLGLNIGRDVSDKVNFYVKASINHDFLGDYDVRATDLTNGDTLHLSDSYGSSWFDYGAGFTVKTGKGSYAYFDIERAMGGEYKKNWDWNLGLRWSF